MLIADIMSTDVVTVEADTPLVEVLAVCRRPPNQTDRQRRLLREAALGPC